MTTSEQEGQLRYYPSRLNIDLPLTPTSDPGWLLTEDDFTLAREHEIESIFAVGKRVCRYAGFARRGKPALVARHLRRRDLR